MLIALLVIGSLIVYAFIHKIRYSGYVLFGWSAYIGFGVDYIMTHRGMAENFYSGALIGVAGLIEVTVFGVIILHHLKHIIEQKTAHEIQLIEHKNLIYRQSRFVTIGESLSHLEHQWRTPLSKIASHVMKLEAQIEHRKLPSENELAGVLAKITTQLEYMSQLVKSFKRFYRHDDEPQEVSINGALHEALELMDLDFKRQGIDVVQHISDEVLLWSYPNELAQVFLNLFANARDMFQERNISHPKIDIELTCKDNDLYVSVEDNAGGVGEADIEKIFDQFYSHKKSDGTGIGLYLCKLIVEERMHGTLLVQKGKSGLRFVMVFRGVLLDSEHVSV